MSDAQRAVDIVRVRSGARTVDRDRAATEEPLEIRLHDRPFAVIMRTPGADRELAAGFLLAERVIRTADDLGTIAHCTDAVDDDSGRTPLRQARGGPAQDRQLGHHVPGENIVNVTLANGSAAAIDRLMADRRQVTTTSSCGMCGRRTIESLAADVPPIQSAASIGAALVSRLPERLRARQAVFDDTGGLHAAGLFTLDGALIDAAEDVGRHNAVDKIVGRMVMRDALPLADRALCVSGRTSFEIVQKAIVAGIPIVAAVSAPSSLAIELAQEFGVTLIGFVRGDGFNIYAHPERVTGPL